MCIPRDGMFRYLRLCLWLGASIDHRWEAVSFTECGDLFGNEMGMRASADERLL